MPNWCSTALAFYVRTEDTEGLQQLKKLQEALKTRLNAPDRKPLESGNWIGRLLIEHGGVTKDELPSSRGFLAYVADDLEQNGDLIFLRADSNDAWSPKLDLWEALLKLEKFNRIGLMIIAEEPGMCLHVTTDADGIVFPEKFKLDYWLKDKSTGEMSGDIEYFSSEAEFLNASEELLGIQAESIEELERKLRDTELDTEEGECFAAYAFSVYEPIRPAIETTVQEETSQ